jgi:LacI family gluconate utilization system Gnt-I transcriptional repressor
MPKQVSPTSAQEGSGKAGPGFDRFVRSGRSTGSVTMADVAKLAGVSPITVSRVLNQPRLVTEETMRLVRDAIAKTGYVPNLLAGGLASRRTRLVAAIIPTLGNAMFIDSIQALVDRLRPAGYQVMLGLSGFPALSEEDMLKAVLSRRPDAVVLTGVNHSEESRERLLAARVPVVEMWALTAAPIDMLVGFAHDAVGTAVADFLYGKGYRRFGIVCAEDERARVRRKSFVEEVGRHGPFDAVEITVPTPTTVRMGREASANLLSGGLRPDAIFCSSDILAMGVLAEAQSRGLAVPGDLAIMGFGDLDFAAFTHPALSTVHVDRAAIGRYAAESLLSRLEERNDVERVIDIGFKIIERGTT